VPTIFLTHVATESEMAIALKGMIEEAFAGSVSVFTASDAHDIPAGQDWLTSILTGLDVADAQVILASPVSITRNWVYYESGAIRGRRRTQIPFCHSGLEPSDLPLPLRILQGGVVGDPRFLAIAFARLGEAVGLPAPKCDWDDLAEELHNVEVRYWSRSVAPRSLDITVGLTPAPRELADDLIAAETLFWNRVLAWLSARSRSPQNLDWDIQLNAFHVVRLYWSDPASLGTVAAVSDAVAKVETAIRDCDIGLMHLWTWTREALRRELLGLNASNVTPGIDGIQPEKLSRRIAVPIHEVKDHLDRLAELGLVSRFEYEETISPDPFVPSVHHTEYELTAIGERALHADKWPRYRRHRQGFGRRVRPLARPASLPRACR
jgi:hypothetical protein